MEDEQLKEQLDSILHSYIIYNLYETVKKDPDLVRDQILNLIEQAGWIDPATCIMPGEYGTPKALKEQIAKFVPAQLEVLSDDDFDAMGYDKDFDTKRTISQATIAYNEAMGQLYRRK